MPRAVKQAAIAPKPASQPAFKVPTNTHLIITTSGGIFSWDQNGVKKLFSSSKKGILAAREAKDGSQVLAVADEHVVVLHDCKRGREESWGLSGNEVHTFTYYQTGIIRLLEYAPDAKSLFLSTSLTGAIQHYSINESRLLDSPSNHPSPPTVLAVSPTSHLMLSASEKPTVIYLQNLTLKTAAIQLHPSASSAAIATASFHPERSNIFLLAFKDGTIAAYDATRIARSSAPRTGSTSRPATNGHTGEISHFSNLHRITNVRNLSDPPDASLDTKIGSKSVAITGAEFLPGFRTRAISVGADGRCRLIDFEGGGKILRTWHAQAPVTSLSISAIKPSSRAANTASKQKAGDTGTAPEGNTVIAVGRVDGQVLLFDSVGLRLDQVLVNALGERIISVEWMDGPSPFAMSTPVKLVSAKINVKHDLSPSTPGRRKGDQSTLPDALRLPPGAVFAPAQSVPAIAVYESEVEEVSTVRYTPTANTVTNSPTVQTTYLDLFSPVKKVSPPRQQQRSPVSSPHLRRKRLSSQTFVKTSSPEPTLPHPDRSVNTPTHLSIHPLNTTIEPKQGSPFRVAPPSARRGPRSGRKRASARFPQGPNRSPIASTGAGRNGKLLADLRKLDTEMSSQAKKNGKPALFAPYMNRTGISNLPRAGAQPTIRDNVLFTGDVRAAEHAHTSRQHEPTQPSRVHFESESHSSDRDIWMSAGSSGDECDLRNEKRAHHHIRQRQIAQPYQQASVLAEKPKPEHVPVDPVSKPEAIAKVTTMSPQPHNASKEAAVLSMSEEAMYSTVSHISNIDESIPAWVIYLLDLPISSIFQKVTTKKGADLERWSAGDEDNTESDPACKVGKDAFQYHCEGYTKRRSGEESYGYSTRTRGHAGNQSSPALTVPIVRYHTTATSSLCLLEAQLLGLYRAGSEGSQSRR
ncbi:WD40 repeat-like protein [Aureobasidium sp. EXF-12298]|nr:WD40 repeat-like protein [Aureobasidium sp. EXF-12298]KAI4758806.1 WD40 repeat-like protein [Aureobasidium sp. EXF-12344]KAI4776072.1 WD40 repeat-like protein [Aureobasidium sp. EXF-3400]